MLCPGHGRHIVRVGEDGFVCQYGKSKRLFRVAYAWKFIHDARTHDLPAIGDLRTLQQIRERRRTMKNGYGLLRKRA